MTLREGHGVRDPWGLALTLTTIALGISTRFGVDAVTFDASPRIFDGLGDKHLPATRVIIYQDGEVLEHARGIIGKGTSVVTDNNLYCCSFTFPPRPDGKKITAVTKHRSDYLAKGLLGMGTKANPDLLPVYDAVFGQPVVTASVASAKP